MQHGTLYLGNNTRPFFNICAPWGGFANHVRWLFLLDSSIDFRIVPSPQQYSIFQGPDWPTYTDFCANRMYSVNAVIAKEISVVIDQGYLRAPVDFDTLPNKLHFIKKYIYHPDRTWHNWIETEFQWRFELNHAIFVEHQVNQIKYLDLPTLCITTKPESALRYYFKFNPLLNKRDKNDFCHLVEQTNEEMIEMGNRQGNLLLDSDCFYHSILNRDVYSLMINWTKFDDQYQEASQVHAAWYQGHLRAQQQFVNTVRYIYR